MEELSPDVDMVISLGGDGTFLRAAEKVGDMGIPIVGINTGHLGFLADVSTDEVNAFLDCLHKGQYEVRSRSVLKTEIFEADSSCSENVCCPTEEESHDNATPDALATQGNHRLSLRAGNAKPQAMTPHVMYALNEVAVTKHDSASMISIQAYVGGEKLTTYHSDGLLVCTPTGSTAYSLSAGGPIIHPQSDVMLLTAVAPHSLNMRPIVISDDKVVELIVDSRSGHFLISVDGKSINYNSGTRLVLSKAPYRINVVKQSGSTWFRTLQQKMNWGI